MLVIENFDTLLQGIEKIKENIELIKKLSNSLSLSDEEKTLLNNNVFLIYVKCYNFDKYGRLLCDISKNYKSKCFSDILFEEKLAYKYTGKTKLTELEQLNELSK